MARKTNECPGVGTGNNPKSQKHLRCLTCGAWATPGATCVRGHDPLAVPVRLDEATRRCSKCGLDQPMSYFRKMQRSPDGLHPWCRPCSSAHAKARRDYLKGQERAEHRGVPSDWRKGQRGMSRALEAKVWRLLNAASDAASAGTWRGRPGIRAYRMLRIALDEWRAPESERVLTGEDSPLEAA